MEVDLYMLEYQVVYSMLLFQSDNADPNAPVDRVHAIPVMQNHSQEEHIASQLSFGAPLVGGRRESFDRDFDLKTAENTNQKDCVLGDRLKQHLLKKLMPSAAELNRKPFPHTTPVQILTQTAVPRAPAQQAQNMRAKLMSVLGDSYISPGGLGSLSERGGFQPVWPRSRLNSQK